MANTVDYIAKYGKYSFREKQRNDVDILILAQFSYLKYDGLIPSPKENHPAITLLALSRIQDDRAVFADTRFEKDNRALFDAMVSSRRFRNIGINFYMNLISEPQEIQFAAMTFFLDDGSVIAAFRGTDESIIGWKEDFNMAFRRPVRSQMVSALYLEQIARRFEENFTVCGHSKGGNLAVYGSMRCRDDVQKRIERIYSFDGPGFRPEILQSENFEKIEKRVTKLLPQSSLVGMLLQNQEDYEVVESVAFGLLQHDPFTWQVKEDHFLWAEDIKKGRKLANQSLNQWILSLGDTEVETFVGILYEIIAASEAKTLIEFTDNWKTNLARVHAAFKGLNEEEKDLIKDSLRELRDILLHNFVHRNKAAED